MPVLISLCVIFGYEPLYYPNSSCHELSFKLEFHDLSWWTSFQITITVSSLAWFRSQRITRLLRRHNMYDYFMLPRCFLSHAWVCSISVIINCRLVLEKFRWCQRRSSIATIRLFSWMYVKIAALNLGVGYLSVFKLIYGTVSACYSWSWLVSVSCILMEVHLANADKSSVDRVYVT